MIDQPTSEHISIENLLSWIKLVRGLPIILFDMVLVNNGKFEMVNVGGSSDDLL